MNRTCLFSGDAWRARRLPMRQYKFLGKFSLIRVVPPASGNCLAHQFSGITLHHHETMRLTLAGPLSCHVLLPWLIYSSPPEITFLLHLKNIMLVPNSWHSDLLFTLEWISKSLPCGTLPGSFNYSGFKSKSTFSVWHAWSPNTLPHFQQSCCIITPPCSCVFHSQEWSY